MALLDMNDVGTEAPYPANDPRDRVQLAERLSKTRLRECEDVDRRVDGPVEQIELALRQKQTDVGRSSDPVGQRHDGFTEVEREQCDPQTPRLRRSSDWAGIGDCRLVGHAAHPKQSTRARLSARLSVLSRQRKHNVGVVAIVALLTGSGAGVVTSQSSAASRGAGAAPCTWYAAPNGSLRSGGRSSTRATTLKNAARQARAGNVVCLLPGTYRLKRPLTIRQSGKPSAWIVFRSYGGRATLTAAGPLNAALIQVHDPAAYVQFSGLSFDGGGTLAYEAIIIGHRVHHVRLLGNRINNM